MKGLLDPSLQKYVLIMYYSNNADTLVLHYVYI